MSRLLAIGDVHGALNELQRLLDLVGPGSDDIVVFLGDYIDRGKDSRGVLEYLIELRKLCPHWVFLAGNHEKMLKSFLTGEKNHYIFNGGETCLTMYRQNGHLYFPIEHIEFINSLQLYYEGIEAFFVHAGVRPGVRLLENTEEDFLWIRNDFIESDFDWEKKVIFGHTPFVTPLVMRNKVGIDTHAHKSGILTAYDPIAHKFYQTKPVNS